jgi:hypothetical protein
MRPVPASRALFSTVTEPLPVAEEVEEGLVARSVPLEMVVPPE